MRIDGRKADELRPITFERGYIKHHPGSVLTCFGDTKVICTATFADRVPPWLRGQGRGWVTAEYAMLPGSAQERIRRDAANRGRAQEISRLIGRSLRMVVDLEAMGECLITVDCDVLQADGGTRTAAITGGYIALYDALQASVARGFLKESPLRQRCAAVSVGVVDGSPLLDLCYHEDADAEVDMNIVMNGDGDFIEVQGAAEQATFGRDRLGEMLDLAAGGLRQIFDLQESSLS